MKANFLFVLLAIIVFTSSCQKQNVAPIAAPAIPVTIAAPAIPVTTAGPAIPVTTAALLGKWSIAKDSTWSQLIGPPSITVYRGTSNDYYDFRSDGKCYKQENGVYDTIAYKVASDTSVIFGNPVAAIDYKSGDTVYFQPAPNVISPLTAHSAKIIFSYASPGGPFCQTIFLGK